MTRLEKVEFGCYLATGILVFGSFFFPDKFQEVFLGLGGIAWAASAYLRLYEKV